MRPPQTHCTYNAAQGAASTLAVTGITADPNQVLRCPLRRAAMGTRSRCRSSSSQALPDNGLTFAEAYGQLGGQVGTDLSRRANRTDRGTEPGHSGPAAASNVSGVSLSAEAAKLLQFQQGYEAIGRLDEYSTG